MIFDILNEKNFFLYAAHHYNNPQCTGIEDFYDDLKSIKYLKRLFNRLINKNELKGRLIVNHIILLSNVFGVEASTKMLFFKLEEQYWPVLKPFLIYLNHLPDNIAGIDPYGDIETVTIPLNSEIVAFLRGI